MTVYIFKDHKTGHEDSQKNLGRKCVRRNDDPDSPRLYYWTQATDQVFGYLIFQKPPKEDPHLQFVNLILELIQQTDIRIHQSDEIYVIERHGKERENPTWGRNEYHKIVFTANGFERRKIEDKQVIALLNKRQSIILGEKNE